MEITRVEAFDASNDQESYTPPCRLVLVIAHDSHHLDWPPSNGHTVLARGSQLLQAIFLFLILFVLTFFQERTLLI